MMRICTNCAYSRGFGSDVWCGIGHQAYESYMSETKCPYFKIDDSLRQRK